MNSQNIILAKILTYAGTLPLVLCVIALAIKTTEIDVVFIVRAYAAIIISFLCGIHWAIFLFFSEKCPRNLLVTSNLIALTAWLSLTLTSNLISMVLQQLCFLYLLMLDLKLKNAGIYTDWFFNLRRNATATVVIAMSVIIGLL